MRNPEQRKRILGNGFLPVFWLFLCVWIPAIGGECDCLPRFSAEDLSLKQIEQTLLLKHIMQGDFDTAETLLKRSPNQDSPFAQDLLALLGRYRSVQNVWRGQQRQYRQELLEKIESARSAAAETPPSRPDEVLTMILKARELAGRQERKTLDADPFTADLTDQIRRKISDWESCGEHEKAWRYGLRALLLMDPNNPHLKEHKKDLLQKVMIERYLTPQLCPGQPNPYETVRADVFYKALRFLERNYAEPVSFSALIRTAVGYSADMGEVLASGRNDFLYAADPNDLRLWNEEVGRMKQELAAKEDSPFSSGPCIQWLRRILDLNERTLRLPEGFLMYGIAETMLAELDPYTEIIWPSRSSEFDKQMTGEFAGVGIRIALDEKKLKVIEVVPGSPAAESGRLRAEDRIKAVDGRSTHSLSLDCAVRLISGPEGSQVVLTIERSGEEETVLLVRRKIVLPTLHGTAPKLSSPIRENGDLSAYRIDRDPRIGYVWISSFKPETPETLRAILQQLQDKCLIGLLLDLRSNSGGVLESAASVADLFLTGGVIVKSQSRDGFRLEFGAKPNQILKDIPLVVLVDGSTASGAEIVAGALAEPGKPRAVLVGTRTYGKGSVQEVEPLDPDGCRIKYTRAFYTLSADREVPNRYRLSREGREDWGLLPHVEVPLNDRQIVELQKTRRQLQEFCADWAKSEQKDLTAEGLERIDSLVRSDPQLATGLTVLKAQILAGGVRLQNQQDPNDFVSP